MNAIRFKLQKLQLFTWKSQCRKPYRGIATDFFSESRKRIFSILYFGDLLKIDISALRHCFFVVFAPRSRILKPIVCRYSVYFGCCILKPIVCRYSVLMTRIDYFANNSFVHTYWSCPTVHTKLGSLHPSLKQNESKGVAKRPDNQSYQFNSKWVE